MTTIDSFQNSFDTSEPSSASVSPSGRIHIFSADYERPGSPLLYSSNGVESTNAAAFTSRIQPFLSDEVFVLAFVAGPLVVFPEASSGISRWLEHRRSWRAFRRAKYEELRRRMS